MDNPVKYGLQYLSLSLRPINVLIKMLIIIVSDIKKNDLSFELYKQFVQETASINIKDPRLLLHLWMKFKRRQKYERY